MEQSYRIFGQLGAVIPIVWAAHTHGADMPRLTIGVWVVTSGTLRLTTWHGDSAEVDFGSPAGDLLIPGNFKTTNAGDGAVIKVAYIPEGTF